MALRFHPRRWMVLMCDFKTGFVEPEMTKARPVVVISEELKGRPGLCTVVPLSTTTPDPIRPYHLILHRNSLPRPMWGKTIWAKCDMLATVSLARLDCIKIGRAQDGKRIYSTTCVIPNDVRKIKKAVLHALSLDFLAGHLDSHL
jgi:mRNA interferase MazF